MKITERINLDIVDTDEDMTFLRQLGVTHLGMNIQDWAPSHGKEPKWHRSPASGLRQSDYYDLEDLLVLKAWVESHGLELYAIHAISLSQRGRSREQQIENFKKSIRNMGKAGIHQITGGVSGFSPTSPLDHANWRTSAEPVGRGGATVLRFDYEAAKRFPVTDLGEIAEKDVWDNLISFLKAVIPVAEESGVRLSHHPADPQVPSLCGVSRILRSVEDYDRLFETVPSVYNCMTFCLGCFSQMMDDPEDAYQAIRHFGLQGKISDVHFRNVRGTLEKFDEVYPDEGKLDMFKAIKTLKEVGFHGPISVDHTPLTVGDTSYYGYRGRAFAIGYLKGLLQAADALD